MKAMSKNTSSESNEPYANFELLINSSNDNIQKINFEMNKSEILDFLNTLPDKIPDYAD